MPLSSLHARVFTLLAFVLCAFFTLSGCKEESSQAKQSVSDFQNPSPTQNALDSEKSQETQKALEGIIAFDAPTITRGENDLLLLIFGAKHCRSCEQLLSSIIATPALQTALKSNIKSYYIHADREEDITIITPSKALQDLSESSLDSEKHSTHNATLANSPHHINPSYKTSELVALYGVRGTPLLVFLSPSGKKLLGYPGFISPERLLLTLEFLKNPAQWDKSERDIAQDLMKLYQDSKLSH